MFPARFSISAMTKPAANAVAICCSVLVFVITIALEFGVVLLFGIGFATVVPDNQGAAIGWDPVSLWHQSSRGKIAIAALVVLPFILPVVAASITFRYVSHRLTS
jgi:hypothetical protein